MPDASNTLGMLYGVGVGPGDPELLTLKAARILRHTSRIFAAASSRNQHSVALSIVQPHLAPGQEVAMLSFPMTRDPDTLRQAWERNAQAVLAQLRQGRDAAFLTLGDPSTYSTFGYLLRTLRDLEPGLRAEVVPGVTSYCAAAALAGRVLAEGEETLAVVSGVDGGAALRRAASVADSLVVLKAYRRFGQIRDTLAELGLDAVLVSACGQEGQAVVRDLGAVEGIPPYFSLVLARGKSGD